MTPDDAAERGDGPVSDYERVRVAVARAICPEQDVAEGWMHNHRVTGDDGSNYPAGRPRWEVWTAEADAAIAAIRAAGFVVVGRAAAPSALARLDNDEARDLYREIWEVLLAAGEVRPPEREGG